MYVCATCTCLVFTETRKDHSISWALSYRQFWVAMWVLGIKPKSSERAANALKLLSHLSSPNEEQGKDFLIFVAFCFQGNCKYNLIKGSVMSEYCQTHCTACEAFLWGKDTGAPWGHVTWLRNVTLLRGCNFLRWLFAQDKPRYLASRLVGEPIVPSLSPICTFCRHWSPAVENKYVPQTWKVDLTPNPVLFLLRVAAFFFLQI